MNEQVKKSCVRFWIHLLVLHTIQSRKTLEDAPKISKLFRPIPYRYRYRYRHAYLGSASIWEFHAPDRRIKCSRFHFWKYCCQMQEHPISNSSRNKNVRKEFKCGQGKKTIKWRNWTRLYKQETHRNSILWDESIAQNTTYIVVSSFENIFRARGRVGVVVVVDERLAFLSACCCAVDADGIRHAQQDEDKGCEYPGEEIFHPHLNL